MDLFESVPNFSEGRRRGVIDAIAAASSPAYELDVDPDPDHNRVVVSVCAGETKIIDGLMGAISAAVERIDLGSHSGVHPRVGAADVVPIIPLGDTSLEAAREAAHAVGRRVWAELQVPVYFYGHGEGATLADIRAGRSRPDLGGPELHSTAGAVCVGARRGLLAFNVILYDTDMVAARALARAMRESSAGLRGVQALAFELPGSRVQLSMNLFRLNETTPAEVIAELQRRGVEMGAEQVVGLSPALAATPAADGRLLEGRMASAAAAEGSRRCAERRDEEHAALAVRLAAEAEALARLPADQDAILGGAERAAALVRVLKVAGVLDDELQSILGAAARGFRAAVGPATEGIYRARVNALDARLA
ncbi:MAG TPA: glutamate formiminotransferase [Verrucomicrobiae bacterium]|nr:glutamate formiminotransferase [Verrucomicrobiae bacterium]